MFQKAEKTYLTSEQTARINKTTIMVMLNRIEGFLVDSLVKSRLEGVYNYGSCSRLSFEFKIISNT